MRSGDRLTLQRLFGLRHRSRQVLPPLSRQQRYLVGWEFLDADAFHPGVDGTAVRARHGLPAGDLPPG